jgi:hypothetical protein
MFEHAYRRDSVEALTAQISVVLHADFHDIVEAGLLTRSRARSA